MAEFSVDVSKWVERAGTMGEAALHAIAMDALARVKALTPVDTGYLRANWTASFDGRVAPTNDASEGAAKIIAEARLGQTLIICNPVVYAMRIEFGFVGDDSLGRHYNQAGRGMMQQTIAEMPSIAEAALRRLTAPK